MFRLEKNFLAPKGYYCAHTYNLIFLIVFVPALANIFSICIFSDIGGFVFGKTFGGKKLTKISPNKTISGSCGSFIFSVLPFFIFYIFYKNTDYLLYNNILFNISSCLYLSLVCQLGDLFISYFKRLAKVKDTGRILPGHGGLLDRIDGIVFALPSYLLFGYFYFL